MTAQKKQAYDLSKFKVLIVEDYEFIRDMLSSSLSEMGVGTTMTAEDGRQAKDKIINHNAALSSSNIDVIVLDWLMPGINGIQLLQWIRSHKLETIRFLPVIVCSGYTSEAIVSEARDNGATEVVVKPVSAEKIAKRVQYVIDRPRPFIKTPDFFGPERRRSDRPYVGDDKRVTKAEEIMTHVERLE